MTVLQTALAMIGMFVALPLALCWCAVYLAVLHFTKPRKRT